jgi:hypothetical protein
MTCLLFFVFLFTLLFSLNSTADWQYGAKEFVKQLPDDVIVHCKLIMLFAWFIWKEFFFN